MLKKWKYPIGGLIVLAALVGLLFNVLQSSNYYLEVHELKDKGESIYGERVQINGEVARGSIDYDVENRMLTFTLTGEGESVPVVYEGIRPNNFDDGVDVVVGGIYQSTGVLEGDQIITKCPSKYDPVVE